MPRAAPHKPASAPPSARSCRPPPQGTLLAALRRLLAPENGRPSVRRLRVDAVAGSTRTRASIVRQALAAPSFRAAVTAEAPELLPGLDAWLAEDAAASERAARRQRRAHRSVVAAQSVAALRAAKAAGLSWEHFPEDFVGEADLPPYPTSAVPGSEEKIAVLTARYQRREALHHPLDAGYHAPDVDLPPVPKPKPAESVAARRRRLLFGPW